MKYWVQQKAKAGNFYDVLGTDNLKSARSYADHQRKAGFVCQVIKRKDIVIDQPAIEVQS